jgi:hypothetical protein
MTDVRGQFEHMDAYLGTDFLLMLSYSQRRLHISLGLVAYDTPQNTPDPTPRRFARASHI